MSELKRHPRSRSGLGTWSTLIATGVALLGHILAIATAMVAAYSAGGDYDNADLDAGGRFAVICPTLCTYLAAQTLLLAGIFIVSGFARRGVQVGLFTGWGGGMALVVGLVAAWVAVSAW